jgi:nicotinamide mononucleotide transporter
MWAIDFSKGGETISTLAMWSIFLINAVVMFVRWHREAKHNEGQV